MSRPEALILAGPNGAGKTTSSVVLVPAGTSFLNADLITASLIDQGHSSSGAEVAAGRMLLEQLRGVVDKAESFCVETNLADRGYARRIALWHKRSYVVSLVFTALDSPELAINRVAARVASGGHDVPEEVIRRRWSAGLRALFDLYMPIVDHWVLLDSSDGPVISVASGAGSGYHVTDQQRWGKILTLASEAGASTSHHRP